MEFNTGKEHIKIDWTAAKAKAPSAPDPEPEKAKVIGKVTITYQDQKWQNGAIVNVQHGTDETGQSCVRTIRTRETKISETTSDKYKSPSQRSGLSDYMGGNKLGKVVYTSPWHISNH